MGKNRGEDMKLINGKEISTKTKNMIKAEIEEIRKTGKRVPKLAVILVGDNQASQVYVRNKEKACAYVGMESLRINRDANFSEEDLLKLIDELNHDESVDGILGAVDILARKISGDLHEGVGGAGHSGENHDVATALADQVGDVANTFGRAHGSAAEFEYFHSCMSFLFSILITRPANCSRSWWLCVAIMTVVPAAAISWRCATI